MTRVYIDMVADLFHIGHLNILRNAKEFGDELVVGIHSDRSAESYKRKPIISEEDRYQIVAACKYVDALVKDAPLVVTEDFIRKHRIDLIVKGDDFREAYSDFYAQPIKMGIMRYVPYTGGISTTDLIRRIKNDR